VEGMKQKYAYTFTHFDSVANCFSFVPYSEEKSSKMKFGDWRMKLLEMMKPFKKNIFRERN
jgi:hypothetical protein